MSGGSRLGHERSPVRRPGLCGRQLRDFHSGSFQWEGPRFPIPVAFSNAISWACPECKIRSTVFCLVFSCFGCAHSRQRACLATRVSTSHCFIIHTKFDFSRRHGIGLLKDRLQEPSELALSASKPEWYRPKGVFNYQIPALPISPAGFVVLVNCSISRCEGSTIGQLCKHPF